MAWMAYFIWLPFAYQPVPLTPAKPAEDPAAKAPDHPVYDAKVGEWVRLRSVVQGEETIATLRVIEVGDDEVKLESRVAYGGAEIKGAVLDRPRRERFLLNRRGGPAQVVVGKETLEVRGKTLECVTITRKGRRGRVDKRWFSNEVPVDGLVRHERGGKVVKELLDWGTGEPPALPSSN